MRPGPVSEPPSGAFASASPFQSGSRRGQRPTPPMAADDSSTSFEGTRGSWKLACRLTRTRDLHSCERHQRFR